MLLGSFRARDLTPGALLNLVGGFNRGKPDEEELKNAEKFARDLLNLLQDDINK